MLKLPELQLGELLHDDLFGLFEAMSAIEMMDPKMDAGMLCNRGNKPPLTLNQAIKVCLLLIFSIAIQNLSLSSLIQENR